MIPCYEILLIISGMLQALTEAAGMLTVIAIDPNEEAEVIQDFCDTFRESLVDAIEAAKTARNTSILN